MFKSFPCSVIKTFLPRFLSTKRCKTSMSGATNWRELARQIIPPLTSDKHKGVAGRIGVVGGCREYTGAPYFAGITVLKVGADLSHVFCTSCSAAVIKSYSPELIVHPLLDSPGVIDEMSEWLPRMHALVIGPGLGRSPATLSNVKEIIAMAIKHETSLVIDADGVFLLSLDPSIIRHYKKAILTPNKIEFARLYKSLTGKALDLSTVQEHHVQEVCQMLGNVTIACKGPRDIISNGETVAICDEPGSNRRCGGQGDLLCGAMGTFSHWAHSYQSQHPEVSMNATIVAAWAACDLTRRCNRLAFAKKGRSTMTSDMIQEIHASFQSLL